MKETNVLVVVDAQVDFSIGSVGTAEAAATIPAITEKINKCGAKGWRIVATKDTHGSDYMDTNEGKHLPIPHTLKGTDGWEFPKPISAALSYAHPFIVQKSQFGSLDLPSVVRTVANNNIEGFIMPDGRGLRITVIGWCTDICVISNALILKAAFPEAEIVVDSSCCAGVTPEKHEAALEVMRSCQITVI